MTTPASRPNFEPDANNSAPPRTGLMSFAAFLRMNRTCPSPSTAEPNAD